MKRLLRILFGLPMCPLPLFLGTYIWMWDDSENWWDAVGSAVWYLASGQWDKLPD